MIFKRKVYDELLYWKEHYSGSYAAMLEGPRRVGKSTIAEHFAKGHFRTYIKVDFSHITKEWQRVFDEIEDTDVFFLNLQAVSRTKLYLHESVIIFDEIQLMPKVRQAIKHLVADGRYSYIETGSLISIKKNVKGIVIPSEEHKIEVHPMDYEEFLWANGENADTIREIVHSKTKLIDSVNNKLMRDFRIYMAVGGMPQAVSAYVEKKNFKDVDFAKRKIIELYKDDFKKIDSSETITMLFDDIPSQLSLDKKRFMISSATGKRKNKGDDEKFYDLLDSKTVLACYNVREPSASLAQTRSVDSYKLYYADTGLFVTQIFGSSKSVENDIYVKLLSNGLRANLGYLYENAVAQIISSSDRRLYYHTWQKKDSTHYFEIDFLLESKGKVIPIEVKSSSVRNHKSIDEFGRKYSGVVLESILLSQKGPKNIGGLDERPIYMLPFILEEY